jgi:hypothetical protein
MTDRSLRQVLIWGINGSTSEAYLKTILVKMIILFIRVVDPDPDSVTLWIRIQGQENKEISVEKCTF